MAKDIDLRPVTHITTDAIGQPGKRVFYLQGQQDARTVTLIVEKFQVQSLCVGIEQFMAELQQKFPLLHEASADYIEANMRIHPPVDPLFRVGDLALGYDGDNDLTIIVAHELVPASEEAQEELEEEAEESEEADESAPDRQTVRFWCTRSQARALAHWGMEVVSRGRPLCNQCGAPIDPEEGHFCPKKNGHRQ